MKPKRLVCGVGINDAGYVVKKNETTGYENGKRRLRQVWACPYFQAWKNMIRRCYSAKLQERYPTYKGCSVSGEWLTFSVFKSWMKKQDFEGKSLDKDLLFEGNKVYSPETCVFVSGVVNGFTTDSKASRGDLLIGAHWYKRTGKFVAKCSNQFTGKLEHLGYFTTELEAHQAWAKRKLELAHELSAIQTDPRIAKALINRYSKPYDAAANQVISEALK